MSATAMARNEGEWEEKAQGEERAGAEKDAGEDEEKAQAVKMNAQTRSQLLRVMNHCTTP